jgi:GTP1/Obg family GTP-binding protein
MAKEASDSQKARKRAAQQLDALTKALVAPLSRYGRGFPPPARLHPFERALLDLTVGTAPYERALARVAALRKGVLELGKGHAGCVLAPAPKQGQTHANAVPVFLCACVRSHACVCVCV